MDDADQPINPSAPEQPRDSADRMAQETRIRLELQRRLSYSDEAQVLSEKVGSSRGRHRLRKLLIFLVLVCGIFIIGALALNMAIVPRVIAGLPSFIRVPYQTLPGYKRTISGSVDYYPPLVVSPTKTGISEFDHGASFSFISSADVLSHKGIEGVLRLDINKTQASTAASDIDVGYKVLFPQKQGTGIYFFFNHWPSYLQDLGIAGDSRGIWFGYDSQDKQTSQPDINELLGLLNPESNQQGAQHFINALWTYASAKGALQWKVQRLFYSLSDGTRAADIQVSIDPDTFPSTIAAFVKDPSYTGDIKAIGDSPVAGTTVAGLLGSIRSLTGLITVGITDHFIHQAVWNFDINDPAAGTYRGTVTSALDLVQAKKDIVKPQQTKSAIDILDLIATGTPDLTPATVATTTDSDGDGLSDSDEINKYHTDPFVADTDHDGFSDGAEVRMGYNPLGPGKLKQ